jgi:hypothetical protein
MASIVQLKRSALSGKVPDTGSLNLGELAVNTYDGKIYFKKSGSIESVESVVTTNSVVTGSIRLEGTGSFGSLKVNDTLTVNHGVSVISGSLGITSDLTVLGAVNARQFNISIISSSTLFESGSSNFGNSFDDTHTFTGSVNITGSFLLNGQEVGGGTTSGSFTGSFTGDGSGLRGVVSDDLPIDGWDYNSNSSASISEFNVTSSKYLIDFQWEQEVGTAVGLKAFLSNTTGSSQIVPTEEGIKFIVGNQQVALVGPNGIQSVVPAGTVSGSSQLTSSYDQRYVLSGSITQTTWDNIASKPSGIISGSSQLTSSVLATTGSNLFVGTQTHSGSIIPATDNTYDLGSPTYQWRDIYVSSGSLYIDGTKVLSSTNQELQITTDVGQSIKILEAGSDSIILQSADGDIQLKTSGGGNLLFDPTTGLIDVRGTLQIQDGNKVTSSGGNGVVFGNNIVVSGSLESTGNINGVNISTFSSSVVTQISTIQTKTGSFATTGSNTFYGTQTFSGSLYVANDLIVQGSSSIQYISASSVSIGTNIVQLNTANPSVRYAGLSIIDSGSVGGSGSFLYDSVQDEFIFVHRGNGANVTSSHFVLGPETYDDLGNEIYLTNNKLPKGTGKEHLVDSNITDNGTLINLGSNTTITGTLVASGTTLVSGSSQITFSGISSLPTLVSGSSQVDVMSTTNIARLATTGSNTFIGNQIISGSSTFRNNSNGASVSIGGTAFGIRIDNGGTFSSGRSTIYGVDNTFVGSYQPLGLQGSVVYIGTSNTDIMTVASTGASVVGNISLGASNTSYVGPSQYGALMMPRGGILFSNTNSQNQMYMVSNAYLNGSGVWSYRNSGQPAGWMAIDNGGFSVALAGNGTADSAITFTSPLSISNAGVTTFGGNVIPNTNGTRDLGSASARWSTIYTSDLSLNNGIGDWTIVEGEDDLFLYNNKKGKVYKFALTEVDPNVATPKKS